MRIFNLTDISTDALIKAGMANKPVVFARHVIAPGESIDVVVPERNREALQQLVSMGVLAVDSPPPSYVVSKARRKPVDPKLLEQVEKKRRAIENRGG